MPEPTTTIHKLPKLKVDKINQVYFGKQGCACGCGGNYHETPRMKKLALTRLKEREKEGLEVQEGLGDDKTIFCWEGEKRAIRIYTKQKVSKKRLEKLI
jgi:hypothetical protein